MRGVTAMSSGDFVGARGSAACACESRRSPRVWTALDRQRAKAERVAEAGGELFELHDAARLGLLVDAIERGHAEVFKPGGDALVGGEHELFDEAVGPGALGAW